MDLFYEIQGEGLPLVMLHSPGVDSREWKYVAPRLAQTYKVITFDGRGTGHSPAPQTPINLVEDLRMLLEHLGLERVTLIGHSMGGQAVTDFTLTYPSMVERLVVVAPWLTGFVPSPEYTGWMESVNSAAPDVSRLVELSLAGPNYRITMAGPHRDFLREMTTQYMTRVFTEWKSFEVIWPEPPAIERLESIAVRTMFIHGTVEWPEMFKIAEQFKRIPAIRFVEMDRADHMLTLTHADELARHIDDFIEGKI
ncbi:alpha/beta fold hydrolase [Paenibacillus tuaregi]|uniref:alpha/beta fold hydrolase n=1 Tax=Paenibacillus tuaregi TaxID=1816681 RepID=UPI000837D9B3|nr:alpha/beta hydrolase [Paenibacillus tuaregi]